MNLFNIDKFNELLENKNPHTFQSIGEQKEKKLHYILKNCLCDDKNCQEIKVSNFIVDAKIGDNIYEIQTANFNNLRKKLDFLLKEYQVTIVYPVPFIKTIYKTNANGELISTRISPKKGSIYNIAKELYKIKMFLKNANLTITVLLLNVDEIVTLKPRNHFKQKSTLRLERFPTKIVNEVNLGDYKIFLESFNNPFTNKEFAKENKISINEATMLTNVLKWLELIHVVGKNGLENIYEKIQER